MAGTAGLVVVVGPGRHRQDHRHRPGRPPPPRPAPAGRRPRPVRQGRRRPRRRGPLPDRHPGRVPHPPHRRPAEPWPAGTTVILDEAGMTATDDLHRLVTLADRHRWRLVAVGDPAQLPAVGRGGVFAHWCNTIAHHELTTPRRFDHHWEADASLALRAGDPRARRRLRDTTAACRPPTPRSSPATSPTPTSATPTEGRTVADHHQHRRDRPGHQHRDPTPPRPRRPTAAACGLADGTQVSRRRPDRHPPQRPPPPHRPRREGPQPPHLDRHRPRRRPGSSSRRHPERGTVTLPGRLRRPPRRARLGRHRLRQPRRHRRHRPRRPRTRHHPQPRLRRPHPRPHHQPRPGSPTPPAPSTPPTPSPG